MTGTYKGPAAPPSPVLVSSPLYRPSSSRCTKASQASAVLHLTITIDHWKDLPYPGDPEWLIDTQRDPETYRESQRDPKTPREIQSHPDGPRDTQRHPERPRDTQRTAAESWSAWATGPRATSVGRWSVSWSVWETGPGWTRASAAHRRLCRGWSAPSTTPSLSSRTRAQWTACACRTWAPHTHSRNSPAPLMRGQWRRVEAVVLLSKVGCLREMMK